MTDDVTRPWWFEQDADAEWIARQEALSAKLFREASQAFISGQPVALSSPVPSDDAVVRPRCDISERPVWACKWSFGLNLRHDAGPGIPDRPLV